MFSRSPDLRFTEALGVYFSTQVARGAEQLHHNCTKHDLFRRFFTTMSVKYK